MRSPEVRTALKAARKLIALNKGAHVLSGPFAGMKYTHRSIGSAYPPKLLGTYEKELHSLLEQLFTKKYATVIDIGAAEGYYAVGAAFRMPHAQVIAFEGESDAEAAILEMAAANGAASRVKVRGLCTTESLGQAIGDGQATLIICDCEGGERELLDPSATPGLLKCDALVEIHDYLAAGAHASIVSRFSSTHHITAIATAARNESDWPIAASDIPLDWRGPAMAEYREPTQQWPFLEVK